MDTSLKMDIKEILVKLIEEEHQINTEEKTHGQWQEDLTALVDSSVDSICRAMDNNAIR